MKFIFTDHAKKKFIFFKSHKVIIKRKQVTNSIINGKISDRSEFPKLEVVGAYNKNYSLVTIYRKEGENYIVITFWIAEKGRYERKIQ